MRDLIDRKKLLRDIEYYNISDGLFQHWVEIQPSVNPDPVNESEWVACERSSHMKCEKCGIWAPMFEGREWLSDYCPKCGAEMSKPKELKETLNHKRKTIW